MSLSSAETSVGVGEGVHNVYEKLHGKWNAAIYGHRVYQREVHWRRTEKVSLLATF